MKSVYSYLLLALLLANAPLISPPQAEAGTGNFTGGDFNFCASVRFNATPAQLDQIKAAFRDGSQVLADATDGQHKFGTISIVNNSGASTSSEYWVNAGSGRAYATQGQYGVRGQHINMYFNSNFQNQNPPSGDAYTIAHEHAHHAYGVLDEYSGPINTCTGTTACAESAPFPDTQTLNYSLMDNYFTRGGRAFGSTYTLNEFDVASNFDPDQDTWQYAVHKKSVWEVIAAHPKRSASAPATLPVDAPPSAHAVNFIEGFGGMRVMLLLDRSGSMALENRLELAKSASSQFLAYLGQNQTTQDAVGVASFDDSSAVNYPLTTITNQSTISAAQAAVNAITLGGATNIGGGLLTALGQITGQSQRSCNEIIVLLTDGDHNTGTAPLGVLPTIKDQRVTVFTVGLGAGISTSGQATLQTIANQTGGKYYQVASPGDVVGLFSRLAAETSGNGLLQQAPNPIAPGETKNIPILVEAGVENIVFGIAFPNTTDILTLTLRSPSGVTITEGQSSQLISFSSGPNSKSFRVLSPEEGQWTMEVVAGSATTGTFQSIVSAKHDGVLLSVSAKKDTLVYPEAVQLEAVPMFNGEAVVGATVTGIVTRPGGSKLPITLYDDGITGGHGDQVPNDGKYSGTFNAYNDDGTYTFDVIVQNVTGKTYAGESLFSNLSPSNEKPVPQFVRADTVSAVVTGVPDFVAATVEFGPETINLKSAGNFVTAYIELPSGFNPSDIGIPSVKIKAINGSPITPLPAQLAPIALGDFDNDGIADLMVKFDRQALQKHLSTGMVQITVEGLVGGQQFIGTRSVAVIAPGK